MISTEKGDKNAPKAADKYEKRKLGKLNNIAWNKIDSYLLWIFKYAPVKVVIQILYLNLIERGIKN